MLAFFLYGCSAIPTASYAKEQKTISHQKEQQQIISHEIEQDRSGYYPLAVVSSIKPPVVEYREEWYPAYKSWLSTRRKWVFSNDRRYAGTEQCVIFALVSPLSLAFCTPWIVREGVADIVQQTRYQSMLHDSKWDKFVVLAPSQKLALVNSANSANMRHSAMEYLNKRNVSAQEFTTQTLPVNASDQAKFLSEHGYPMMLRLSLISLYFSEIKSEDSYIGYTYCLVPTVRAQLIHTSNGEEVLAMNVRDRKCQSLADWHVKGAIKHETDKLYTALAINILDRLIFTYRIPALQKASQKISEPDDSYITFQIIGLNPINPKVSIKKLSVFMAAYKDSRLIKLTSLSKLPIVEVGTKPRFEWSTFRGQHISGVHYDFRLYKGAIHINTSQTDHSDTRRPKSKYIIPKELVYKRNNISEPYLHIDSILDSCSWYYWTVRAVFNLNGYPRVTEWSGISEKGQKQGSMYSSYFPFRTSASKGDPTCWDTADYK
ncbi:MAG: hypothetical protein P8019_15830 [Gammaproteobacteria bacterium]